MTQAVAIPVESKVPRILHSLDTRLPISGYDRPMTRFLIATILSHLDYKEIRKRDLPPPRVTTVILTPSVEIDIFSSSMGPWKIGRTFQEEDSLNKAIKMQAVLKTFGSNNT